MTFDPSGVDLNGPTSAGGLSSAPPFVSTPAVPAANVNLPNETGYDCMVYITGFTAANVWIGGPSDVAGVTTGLGSGAFYVPAGFSISLGPYTAAGTWKWQAI